MFLYKIDKDIINEIFEKPFKKERDMQNLCENNLTQIFNLELIKSEFSIHNFRIDTLGFDTEKKSFVIIEYKRDRNFSVVDQGYTYLSLMLNNKADFILEYNESSSDNLKRSDVDWSQSKVIFVAPNFTSYQKESINFRDLPIELWEIKRYEQNLLYFNQIKPLGATESIKTISKKSKYIDDVNKEIKVYTEKDHIENSSEEIFELYYKFKEAILNLGNNISINPTKLYISFVSNKRNITDIIILKKSLKVCINLKIGELDDPKGITRDVSKIGHWGNGDYKIKVNNDDNLEYIISLIKQSYKKANNI